MGLANPIRSTSTEMPSTATTLVSTAGSFSSPTGDRTPTCPLGLDWLATQRDPYHPGRAASRHRAQGRASYHAGIERPVDVENRSVRSRRNRGHRSAENEGNVGRRAEAADTAQETDGEDRLGSTGYARPLVSLQRPYFRPGQDPAHSYPVTASIAQVSHMEHPVGPFESHEEARRALPHDIRRGDQVQFAGHLDHEPARLPLRAGGPHDPANDVPG